MRSRRNLIKTTAVAALGVGVTGVRAAAAKAASLGTAQYDALGVGTPPSTAGIQVQGSLAGALVSIKQLASTGHALVAYLAVIFRQTGIVHGFGVAMHANWHCCMPCSAGRVLTDATGYVGTLLAP